MTYQGVLNSIREDTQRKVMAAWRMYGIGAVDKTRFLQLASAILGQAGSAAAAAADLAISFEMTRLNRRIAATAGVIPTRTMQTYMDSLKTVLDEGPEGLLMRLERLSLNAPLDAAQEARGRAIEASGASGWVRQMDADPCQLCRWWWREGRVWPADHPIPRHSGCECVARPVIVDYKPQKASY